VDPTGRHGIIKDGVMTARKMGESVVVADADAALAKNLAKVSGARLIGVWVGLNTVVEFKSRLEKQIEGKQGECAREGQENCQKSRVSAGLSEFAILNVDEEKSSHCWIKRGRKLLLQMSSCSDLRASIKIKCGLGVKTMTNQTMQFCCRLSFWKQCCYFGCLRRTQWFRSSEPRKAQWIFFMCDALIHNFELHVSTGCASLS
jgi:hypothetical protein